MAFVKALEQMLLNFVMDFGRAESSDAVRNAVSLGGHVDILACIAGAMAEAYYGGVPGYIQG